MSKKKKNTLIVKGVRCPWCRHRRVVLFQREGDEKTGSVSATCKNCGRGWIFTTGQV